MTQKRTSFGQLIQGVNESASCAEKNRVKAMKTRNQM